MGKMIGNPYMRRNCTLGLMVNRVNDWKSMHAEKLYIGVNG